MDGNQNHYSAFEKTKIKDFQNLKEGDIVQYRDRWSDSRTTLVVKEIIMVMGERRLKGRAIAATCGNLEEKSKYLWYESGEWHLLKKKEEVKKQVLKIIHTDMEMTFKMKKRDTEKK